MILIAAVPVAAQEPAQSDTTHRGMMGAGMQCPMMQGMMGGGQGMMPGMMPMGEMMGPMMRGMAFNPAYLLARKEALGLTAQQETRLASLRDAAKAEHDAAAANAAKHLEALVQVIAAARPDTTAAKRQFEAAQGATGAALWAGLRAAAQAKAVLTDAQRGRVEGWEDARQMHLGHLRGMGGGMNMMDMNDCPMMKGGMPGDSMMQRKDG